MGSREIRCVEIFRANVTFTQPRRVAFGMIHQPGTLVVRVTASDGAFGWGSTVGVGAYNGQTVEMLVEELRYLGQVVLRTPPDIGRLHHLMDANLVGNPAAKAALDLAVYDLTSRALGVPVVDLLGGRLQEQFRAVYSLRLKDRPEEMGEEALRHVADGVRGFEMHVGTTVEQDVARVRAVREAVGTEVPLVCDANQHWTPKEAIRAIRALDDLAVTAVEQPTRGLAGMAEVRSAVATPITADESCHTVADAVEVIQHQAADAVCIKLIKAGGLYPSRRIAEIAQAFGLSVRVDGVPGETRLSTTAAACLVSSLPRVLAPGVMQYRHLKEDLVGSGGLDFKEGLVAAPAGPGLADSLDESLLEPIATVE